VADDLQRSPCPGQLQRQRNFVPQGEAARDLHEYGVSADVLEPAGEALGRKRELHGHRDREARVPTALVVAHRT
jgi:hypothetical protein